MENQNQHYDMHDSMYVANENEEKEFLHSEEDEKPEVTGDPSENASSNELNSETTEPGYADTDHLLSDIASSEDPDDDDVEDDDLDEDDLDDDDLAPDDEILPDPDSTNLDDDDDDLDDDALLNRGTDEETFLK